VLLRTDLNNTFKLGLLRNTNSYFQALGAYRAGDAAKIIREFAAASHYAAVTGKKLVDDLSAGQTSARERLGHLRSQAGGWALLPHLIAQPVVNLPYLQQALGMSAMSASRALAQLTDAGILTEATGLRRNRVWQQSEILNILDDYASSIRRSKSMQFRSPNSNSGRIEFRLPGTPGRPHD